MANFDWRSASIDAADRFDGILDGDGKIDGYRQWKRLVEMLREFFWAAASDEQLPTLLGLFDEFLRSIDQEYPPEDPDSGSSRPGPLFWPGAPKPTATKKACRVFVSHQRNDVPYAERIAYLAQKEGFEYWLDVHDPVLRLANSLALPPIVQSILIAAIIEIALLNCSHAITVQTFGAQQSRWVPYEFGRAKNRNLVSTQVASWFDNGVYAATSSDYLRLGVCALSEAGVERWLKDQWSGQTCLAGQVGPLLKSGGRLPN